MKNWLKPTLQRTAIIASSELNPSVPNPAFASDMISNWSSPTSFLLGLVAGLSLFYPFDNSLSQNNVARERERKVAEDVSRMQDDDYWIYNDLVKAKQIATDAKKPMLIVFR